MFLKKLRLRLKFGGLFRILLCKEIQKSLHEIKLI